MSASGPTDDATSPSFGPLIDVYGPSLRRRSVRLALLGVGLLASLVAFGVGGYRWYLAYTHYGPAVVWPWSLPWFSAGALFALLTLVVLIMLLAHRRLEVRLYQGGLVYQGRGPQIALAWNQVRQIRASAVRYGIFGLIWGGEMDIWLEGSGERRLHLTRAFSNLPELVDSIKQKVYPLLLASYTRAFNRGGTLAFGPLEMNGQGLTKGSQKMAWGELESAVLDRGVLTLQPVRSSRARRIRLPAHQVPNVDICLQLIQNLGQRA